MYGDASGEPCWVEGRVLDIEGRPLPGARIEVWEADDEWQRLRDEYEEAEEVNRR